MSSLLPKINEGALGQQKFQLLAVALLFVSGLGVCRANLGETEAQCITRYGNESDMTDDVGYRQVGDKAVSFNIKTPIGSLDKKIGG
jgi:hypothetical protein